MTQQPQQGSLFTPASLPAPPPRLAPATLLLHQAPKARLRLCVLGSGSGGNSSVLCVDEDIYLIDAGFGPRTLASRLRQADIQPSQVRGVLVTHLDHDHLRPAAFSFLLQWRIPLYVHHWHLPLLEQFPETSELYDASLVLPFDWNAFEICDGLMVLPTALPHDDKGTVGFRLDSPAGSVGYATDLGVVPESLISHFACIDVLAIESNYDADLQLASSRPVYLKHRIMGGRGHLSNHQAFEAVRRITELSPEGSPQHIVLLHRSRHCNDPALVRQVFEQEPAIARRTILAEQRRRSRWLEVHKPSRGAVQRSMF